MSNPSSHPHREPQPVNPYAASQHAEAIRDGSSQETGSLHRTFGVHMTWADRQAFLRSVGPIRFGILCSGLLWMKQLFDLIRGWQSFFQDDAIRGWTDAVFLVISLSVLVQGVIAIYLCWLNWRFADVIREVAGGTTSSLHEWSRLSYRVNWIGAIWFGIVLATEIVQWFVSEALTYRLFVD